MTHDLLYWIIPAVIGALLSPIPYLIGYRAGRRQEKWEAEFRRREEWRREVNKEMRSDKTIRRGGRD